MLDSVEEDRCAQAESAWAPCCCQCFASRSGLLSLLAILRCNLKTVSKLLLILHVLLMNRSSFLMPKVTEAEEALLELKELGPLGIPPSSPLSAACNPFATQLVLKAFTDMPAVPTGVHT